MMIPEESNFVILGAWNQAIINPDWLYAQFPDIITEAQANIRMASMTNIFQIEYNDFFLDPCGGRLLFIPKSFEKRTLSRIKKLALGIYERLKHTPIFAAGHNFVYRLGANQTFKFDDIEKDDETRKLYPCFDEGYSLVDQSTNHTFMNADCKISVGHLRLGEQRAIKFNFDYSHPTNLDPMRIAAEKLAENLERAEAMVKLLVEGR